MTYRNHSKVITITGDFVDIRGIPCAGVYESFIRQQVLQYAKYIKVRLVFFGGGFVIRTHLNGMDSGAFLMSEHSRSMRVFKSSDAAFRVLSRLGVSCFEVLL